MGLIQKHPPYIGIAEETVMSLFRQFFPNLRALSTVFRELSTTGFQKTDLAGLEIHLYTGILA